MQISPTLVSPQSFSLARPIHPGLLAGHAAESEESLANSLADYVECCC